MINQAFGSWLVIEDAGLREPLPRSTVNLGIFCHGVRNQKRYEI